MSEPDFFPGYVAVAVSAVMLVISLYQRRRQRLLADLPTSKAHGVFIGLIELKGTAESAIPLRSFLRGAPCVHYRFEVEEHWSRTVTETYTDKEGKRQTRTRRESGWTTVSSGGETQDFYVGDETGFVLVRPSGAKLEPAKIFDETVSRWDPLYYGKGPLLGVSDSDHRRRFVERAIVLHAPLYVVGQARERRDIVAPEIVRDPQAPMFLISTRSEESVQDSHALGSWIFWALGFVGAAAAGPLSTNEDPLLNPVPLIVGACGYLAAWLLGWTWMVFNSLVGLRHRVRQGWSQVDVQLKRRHDLIPGLLAVVSALGAHEQAAHVAIAALRTQLAATRPGAPGPDFAGLTDSVRAVVENHPSLAAQQGFARLHSTLVETEQRIALARTYYNDIATHFATRLAQLPDRWVAGLTRMRPEPLLTAESFERAPVAVSFADGRS